MPAFRAPPPPSASARRPLLFDPELPRARPRPASMSFSIVFNTSNDAGLAQLNSFLAARSYIVGCVAALARAPNPGPALRARPPTPGPAPWEQGGLGRAARGSSRVRIAARARTGR